MMVVQLLINKLHYLYVENLGAIFISALIAFGMVASVWVLEWWFLGFRETGLYKLSDWRDRTIQHDAILFLINIFAGISLIAAFMSLGIPFLLRKAFLSAFHLDIGTSMPSLLSFSLYFIFLDFCNYWQHRLLHRLPFLWHIHKFHHSADKMTTLTVLREHPLDKALNALFTALPAAIIGVPVAQYPILVTLMGLVGYLKHSNLHWQLGWFGTYVIQSPRDHWIHHSTQSQHYNSNFANNFAIWDHLFGTYYQGDDLNPKIGILEENLNQDNTLKTLLKCQSDCLLNRPVVTADSQTVKPACSNY